MHDFQFFRAQVQRLLSKCPVVCCVYPASATTLGIHPIENSFHGYIEGNCVYHDKCNGTIIPGSETIIAPTLDLANGSGRWLTECKVPAYCPNVGSVGDMHVDKEWVKAAEYRQILTEAWNYGFDQSTLDSRWWVFTFNALNDCDNVRYCPANLRITTVSHTLSENVNAVSAGDGCYYLDCTPWLPGNNNFCVDDPDFLPDLFEQWGQGGNVVETCNPASANLYQLIVWEDALKDAFPGNFENSPLHSQYIEQYRNNPVAKCARVIFCQSDFSVLWSNVSSVVCGEYDYINNDLEDWDPPTSLQEIGFVDCGPSVPSNQPAGDCINYYCYDPLSTNLLNIIEEVDDLGSPVAQYHLYGNLERICPEFPGVFFTTPGTDGFVKNTIGCTNGEMVNFGNTILEGRRAPKGITKCGDEFYFMDYSINSRMDALEEIPDIEYFIDDWDSSQILLIKRVENEKSYYIDCYSDIAWTRFLSSDVRLKISYFEKEGNEYVIGGEFSGSLFFENNQLTIQAINTGFVIRISSQGTLLNYDIIRNLDPQKPLVFVRGMDGVHIVGRSSNQPLMVNEIVYPVQGGYLTDVRIDTGNEGVMTNALIIDTSLTIVRSQRSLDNSRITYLLRGRGSLQYSGQQVISTETQDLILVTCDATGNVIWTEKINGQNVSGQDFDIAYGSGRSLLVGITYSNSISIQNQVSMSNGNTDILLIRFNENGQVDGMIDYGTTNEENISKMFFADSLLYFGGEFEADTTSRKIGMHTFLTLSNMVSSPYISFITESTFTQEGIRGSSNNSRADIRKAKSHSISVYPNPFNSDLTLKVVSSKFERISFKVFDGLGHLVNEQTQQANLGTNEYSILTSQYPIGVYLIQVLTESGTTWSHKIVKN